MFLGFLNLPESHDLAESKLDTAVITKLQDFLLELGSGFSFVGRQERITLDGDHFCRQVSMNAQKAGLDPALDWKPGKRNNRGD